MQHERIEDLISRTTDPVQQATLLLFVRFDHALDENTKATQRIAVGVEKLNTDFVAHTDRFDVHVQDEKSMLASAKGAWWASTIAIAVVLGLGGYIVKDYAETQKMAMQLTVDLMARVRVLESRHDNGQK